LLAARPSSLAVSTGRGGARATGASSVPSAVRAAAIPARVKRLVKT